MKKTAISSVLWSYRWSILLIMFLGSLWSLRDIVTPYLVKNMIDASAHLTREDLSPVIFRSLMIIIGVWVAMEAFMRLQGGLLLRTIPSIRTEVCQKMLEKIRAYPYAFFLQKMTGNLSDKVYGVAQGVETLLSICLTSFIPILSHLLFSLVLTACVNITLSSLFLVWMVLHLAMTWKMGLKSLGKTEAVAQIRSHLHGKIVDGFFNIFAIKTFCREEYEKKYLDPYLKQELFALKSSQKYLESIRLVLGVSSIFMLMTTLFISYLKWKQGLLSLGGLTLLIMLLLNLTSYLWYLSMELIRFNEELGKLRESRKILFASAIEQLSETGEKDRNFSSPLGRIEVQNICYAYDKPLLNNLTFCIDPGKKVAITGLSGSGKTTFINLLLSHLPIQSGKILIDGIDIQQICPRVLREYFALVPQQPILFHRTIRENIQYGNLEAKEHEIHFAAKMANCHEFILNLTNGYDTIVGERGDKLSGGQKLRIALARALVKKSTVVILDEPTSGLDHDTAMHTLKNILHALEGRTLIVITHNAQVASLMEAQVTI